MKRENLERANQLSLMLKNGEEKLAEWKALEGEFKSDPVNFSVEIDPNLTEWTSLSFTVIDGANTEERKLIVQTFLTSVIQFHEAEVKKLEQEFEEL